MKKKGVSFKFIYLNYIAVLAILVVAALVYVGRVLEDYESAVPEKQVSFALFKLQQDIDSGTFWDKYDLPKVEEGRLESGIDIKEKFQQQLKSGACSIVEKAGVMDPERLVYLIQNEGIDLAEVTLRATSPVMTKLAILNYRTYEVEAIQPIFEGKEYSLTVPSDFTVKINGIELNEEEVVSSSAEETSYATGLLYLIPEVEILDAKGNSVSYTLSKGQIVAEFYYYTLVLPKTLKVELNGEELEGVAEQGGRICYQIRELQKPKVRIADYYGNEYLYEGGNEIPLTYMTISVDSRYKVLVMDQQAPMDVVAVSAHPEYEMLADYVENLPQIHDYEIAVLAKDAKIQVADLANMAVEMEPGKIAYDFVNQAGNVGNVPTAVATEVDALAIAQEWSLFMSNDRSFDDIKAYIVKDSYQYQVTQKYANSVDRKFFSSHTLLDPTFTDETVSNFTWITDNCFSVDISFVKHMALKSGRKVDDAMNDRFYFVKWDDTEDGVDNPAWKIVSMKEIVGHAE